MNTNTQAILAVFKKSLVSFLDELIDQFPTETNLILCRLFVKDQIPIKVTLENFLKKIEANNSRLKLMAKERDESFFLKGNIFYIGNDPASEEYSLSSNTVNYLRKIWLSDLDTDDRKTLWQWFDSFIAIAEKYNEIKNNTGNK